MSVELSPLDLGVRAARRGHTVAARRILDGVLLSEPDNETAVLWRARAAETDAEKAHFLERAVALNPDNRWAADQLAALGDTTAEAPAPSASASRPGEPRAARVHHLQCPNCGGQVEIHPDRGTKAAVCTHCGSVLDLTAAQAEVIGRTRPKVGPRVPIEPGMEATFEGERHLVTGWLRYKGWDDEDTWRWDEWQLVSDSGAVRYLSWSRDEGFLLQSVVRPTPRVTKGGIEMPDGKVRFSETSPAKIEAMRGELTWRPRLDKTLRVAEGSRGDQKYSVEMTAEEIEVSAGPSLADIDVWRAFGRDDMVRKSVEAEDRKERYARIASPALLGILAFLFMAGVASCTGTRVVDAAVTLDRGGTADLGTFEAEAGQTVQVKVRAELQGSNDWTAPDVYVTGPAGTRRYLFTPDLWTWRSGGESESNKSATRLFSAPASGTYRVDVELAESGVSSTGLSVSVDRGVWLARYYAIAAFLSFLLFVVVRLAGGSGRPSY